MNQEYEYRWKDSMSMELNMESSSNEYKPDQEVNRLEVYESLLLDTQSALWREVLHRKESRSSKPVTPSTTTTTKGKKSEEEGVFDIGSEEEEEENELKEKKLPVKDAGRDV
mgnify:CR=1 FL=1